MSKRGIKEKIRIKESQLKSMVITGPQSYSSGKSWNDSLERIYIQIKDLKNKLGRKNV